MSIIEKALNKAKNQGHKVNDKINFVERTTPVSSEKMAEFDSDKNEARITHDQKIIDINWNRLMTMGFITPSDVNSQTMEEYRNIKRPLARNAFGENRFDIAKGNLILITSSVPGEGKTFTAINLALSFANERDIEVLLIDADVARPSVSKVLEITSSVGLIDYLDSDDLSFADIILTTSIPGFKFVPAGKRHKHSTELLSSHKMTALTDELSSKYKDQLVIFDSPPLLAATQGEILAKLVGQVVLVVESDKTLQSLVKESANKLASCDVVHVVLNKTQKRLDEGYYGYGYGYGYGNYGAGN